MKQPRCQRPERANEEESIVIPNFFEVISEGKNCDWLIDNFYNDALIKT